VGNGGRSLRIIGTAVANSEVRYNGGYGVIKFTLGADRYTWEFIAESGVTFTDSGAGTCH
jgi:hypothetical protein